MDAFGRIVRINEYNGGEVYVTTYDYDVRGNLIGITDDEENEWVYIYDSLGRKLAGFDPNTGWSNYTYDANGNILTQTSGGTNLVSGDTYYREYNELGQLVRVREGNDAGGSIIEEYTYDPSGMRIKTYNNVTNTTIYTPFKEFMQIRNSTGIFNYTYVYADGALVARINPGGDTWFYHSDHLGSTTLITNESGQVVEEVAYYPYGLPLTDTDKEVRLYEGKELDSTDQYYFGARYYHPSMRMFTQPDDLIPNVYDPQALNIYAFERGNPYIYLDESGNLPILVPVVVGVVAGGITGAIVYHETGDARKAITAGAISGVAAAGSTLLIAAATTTSVAYGSGAIGTSLTAGEGALLTGGLFSIGVTESTLQQTVVGGRDFNQLSTSELLISGVANTLGSNSIAKQSGQFVPTKAFGQATNKLATRKTVSAFVSSIGEEVLNLLTNLFSNKEGEDGS